MGESPNVGLTQALWVIWKEGGWVFFLFALMGMLVYKYMPQLLTFGSDWWRVRTTARMTDEERDEKEKQRLRESADVAVKEMTTDLRRQIADLVKLLDKREDRIGQLEQHVRQCDTTVASQGQLIGTQQGKITVLEHTVASLNSRVSSLTAVITKARLDGAQ